MVLRQEMGHLFKVYQYVVKDVDKWFF